MTWRIATTGWNVLQKEYDEKQSHVTGTRRLNSSNQFGKTLISPAVASTRIVLRIPLTIEIRFDPVRKCGDMRRVLPYVPRVGNAAARTDRHTWSIQLERTGQQWQIVSVSAQ